MAPPTGSKSRKAGGTKQQVARPVVPALPLPYVKRQAAAAAAAAAAAKPSTPPEPTPESTPEKHQNSYNGATEIKPEAEPVESPIVQQAAESPSDQQPEPEHTAAPLTNGHDSSSAYDAVQSMLRSNGSPAANPTRDNKEMPPHPSTETPSGMAPVRANGAAANKVDPKHQPAGHHASKLSKSRPPPSVSPSRYQMPPPFQPANRPPGMMANGDMNRGRRHPLPNGPPYMHSAHPSNSSIHFGAFVDSQNSSPAPPHSGGIAPPPGMPMPDARLPYMGHAANGFPPMMPYGADMMPVTNFDNYGRPTAAYAPMDSYPPYGNGFGPSTPHSFHGSQSSAHPEDNGPYGQYPPGGPRNGGAGPDDGQQQNTQGRMYGPPEYPTMMPNQNMPPHMVSHAEQADIADRMIGYLQQQFGSPEFGDCTLELRYVDDRAPPLRIPGHRLIFARSSELSLISRQQDRQQSPPDPSLCTLLLKTDSKWVRSDSFYMAIQHLYGLPLLRIPPRNGMDSGNVTEAGSALEQAQFALSYAAAGHLLDWSPIAKRGCEVATQLLSWQTLEAALGYSLDGYSDKGSHETYAYGEGSKTILNAAVTFIVHNFPPSFALDTSATEPQSYERLPAHPPVPPTPTPAVATTALSAAAPESSVQLGQGRRSQNLPNIQFGDMSLSEGKGGPPADTPKAAQQALPVSHAVLSRVLLNLPFTQLKMILESAGSGNVNGWANAEARYRIIKSAVEERESRRLGALEAVIAGTVPNSDAIYAGLRNPSPQALGPWTALGWQEEILPYGNADGPSLGRKWAPLLEHQNASGAEYP